MRLFSRGLTIAGAMACAGIIGTAPRAWSADDFPYVSVAPIDVDVSFDVDIGHHRPPPRIYDPRGTYAAIPPARYDGAIDRPAVAPDQVAAMLRSTGFSLLGPLNRRGWVYTISVLNPRGDDGRAIIDVRTGAIIRFIPAFAVNGRTDQELSALYGPPGLPPVMPEMRPAPRVPLTSNAPKLASRTPAAVPLPRPQPAAKPAAPSGQAAKPVAPPAQRSASVQAKPAEAVRPEATKPVETKPAEAKPAELELKATQDMPPVQPLD